MQLHIEPDLAIPFPEDNPVLANFIEKAQAACNSAELLGLDTTPSEEEKEIAENAVYQVAANPDKANKKLAKSSPKMTPAVYKTVDGILKDYSHRVVENAMQIRLLVTNKLIMESENEDPKIRLRSLELLGKITDVGLFTEKSEVTITHRSSQELVTSLRAKIQKLMYPTDDAVDAEVVEVNGKAVDLNEELGFEEETPETPPETEEKPDADASNTDE